ncbi:MAG: ArsR/SmtB family transcription factor [Candidatus Limnocylindrales bacterium]
MPADTSILPEVRLNLVAPDVEAPVAIAVLLSDRNRATILAMLRNGPLCVCEMAAALDERSNNVSNHLARLREAGLVRASRMSADTRRNYYERDEAACTAALAQLKALLEPAR